MLSRSLPRLILARGGAVGRDALASRAFAKISPFLQLLHTCTPRAALHPRQRQLSTRRHSSDASSTAAATRAREFPPPDGEPTGGGPPGGPPMFPQRPLWGFVRREGPSQAVESFIKGEERGETRLLLLTGPEGVGKSSLLKDCVARLMEQRDGRLPVLVAFDVGLMAERSFEGFFAVARRAAARRLRLAEDPRNSNRTKQCCATEAANAA
ncbi:hypothetical protein cyc_08172 [Cyclospora cayetanensis]|uniref:Uncharacterized protein n=1 Tax=Cyclospora cayetanensis TaxID=88456 RepID=A0A1D3CRD2_9EIME|nr:hypothetical protein cyc_08172 [Cyclospora cayetanensis]